jgi:hypothetical protein
LYKNGRRTLMTIYQKQYEQIQIEVRRDFLERMESSVRQKNPPAFARVPREEVPVEMNRIVNQAAAFGFDHSGEVERFALLDLRLGSHAPRFFADTEVRRLRNDRRSSAVQRIGKLEQLAQAFRNP